MAKFFVYPFAVAGDKSAIPETVQVDGSVSYQSGWGSDYQLIYGSDINAKAIPRLPSNELMYDVTSAIQQYQTTGFPDFVTAADNLGPPFPYPIYAVVRFDDGSGVQLYVNIVDGNTNDPTDVTTWLVVSPDGVPVGSGIDFFGLGTPSGRFLLRDGSAYNRITYARLFAVIGTTWGIGDGSTTFNVPNSSRAVSVGSGGIHVSGPLTTVGSTWTLEQISLGAANNGPHNHTAVANMGERGFSSGGSDTCYTIDLENNSPPIAVGSSGSGTPFSIMQTSEVCSKWIKY